MAAWPNQEERTAIFNNVFTDASMSRYYLIMVVLSCTVALCVRIVVVPPIKKYPRVRKLI